MWVKSRVVVVTEGLMRYQAADETHVGVFHVNKILSGVLFYPCGDALGSRPRSVPLFFSRGRI